MAIALEKIAEQGREREKADAPSYERRKFTLEEYFRLRAFDFFEGERLELINGEVVSMSPIGTRHDTAVGLSNEVILPIFRKGYCVRVQSSFAIPEYTTVLPDIAVLPGKLRDYKDAHPTTAALIVEVAESSLEYDRSTKASLYALAGVPDYWILNLMERRLEVYRDPAPMESEPFGQGYRSLRVYLADEIVTPLEKPGRTIKVAALLP